MILLNGQLLEEADAAVSPLGDGFQLGTGVFTTMRVRDGRVEFLLEHAERLSTDARATGLAPGSDLAVLKERCAACLAANDIVDGGLKVVWFAERGGETGELITPRLNNYGPAATARGFSLMTMRCGTRESRELSRHKTLNYLEHAQAKRAAVAAGFDETLWVDDSGRVLEGATTNVFAVFRDEVVTPDIGAGLLPGVARRIVLAMHVSRPVKTAVLSERRLAEAEEIFVTNSLMGVMPVRAIDGRSYELTCNPVTREIVAAWDRTVPGSLP